MERREQYRIFRRMDSNGDGKISPAELSHCLSSIGRDMTAEEVEKAAALMVPGGDGSLHLKDFVGIVNGAGEEEKASDLKVVFEMYAPEGSITPKSLRRMLSRLGVRRREDECRNMIVRFDLDGDGVLSFDEFRVMMA